MLQWTSNYCMYSQRRDRNPQYLVRLEDSSGPVISPLPARQYSLVERNITTS